MDRRRFLLGTVPVAAAASMASAAAVSGSATPQTTYTPSYFTAAEWTFLKAAIARLIPSDGEGPGGNEAGVPEFIDRQMELPYGHGSYWYLKGPFADDSPPTLGYQLRFTPRDIYRVGIKSVNDECLKELGKAFTDLGAEQQNHVLRGLEAGTFKVAEIPGGAFFDQLLTNTREGYFADPQYGGNRDMVAWRWIGFPGARADFTDWIDQAGKRYPFGPVSISGRSLP